MMNLIEKFTWRRRVMQKVVICLLGAILFCFSTGAIHAQDIEPDAGFQPFGDSEVFEQEETSKSEKQKKATSDYDGNIYRENLEPRMSQSQILIRSRALYRARLRVQRIESRKRQGYSRARPSVWGGQQHIQNLNSYVDAPWLGGYYLNY